MKTSSISHPVPAYGHFELSAIGRCFFQISDGTFVIEGRSSTTITHAEEPYVIPDRWQMVLLLYPGTLVVGGKQSEFIPGTVLVLPPATPLILRFKGDSLHIACHFRLKGFREEPVGDQVPQLTPLEPAGELKHFRNTLDFACEVQRVHKERAGQFVEMLFRQLILSGENEAKKASPDYVHPTVRKAMEWFEIHLADQIKVADLAHVCGISRQHLRNLFLSDQGTTPSRFIRSRRARRAHLLLTQTDRPIKLIADDVGIRDLAHFSRIIKEEYGVSPRQIRRGETR